MNGYDKNLTDSATKLTKTKCTMCRQIFTTDVLEFCKDESCTNLLCPDCKTKLKGYCKEEHLPETEK